MTGKFHEIPENNLENASFSCNISIQVVREKKCKLILGNSSETPCGDTSLSVSNEKNVGKVSNKIFLVEPLVAY